MSRGKLQTSMLTLTLKRQLVKGIQQVAKMGWNDSEAG